MTTMDDTTRLRRLPLRVEKGSPTHRGMQLAGVALVVWGVWTVAGASNFRVGQITSVLIFAIAISGLNLATGYTGLLSIGHSAFYGLGAYTTGILVIDHGWDPLMTLPVAMVLTFVVGVVVGLPALRIRGLYLALVTLAVAVAFPELVRRFDDLTGGSAGLVIGARELLPPSWSTLSIGQRNLWLFWVSLVVLLLVLVFLRLFVRSRWGLALIATRDNEVAAAASGINLAATKTIAFGLSGGITGLGGALFAMYLGALSPEGSFTLLKSIELITGLVIGGAATLLGPILGAVAVVFLPYLTAQFSSGQMSAVLFGVVLITIVFVMPDGVVGALSRLRRRLVVITTRDPRAVDGATRPDKTPSDRAVTTPRPMLEGERP